MEAHSSDLMLTHNMQKELPVGAFQNLKTKVGSQEASEI